ncbi:plasma membrane proteolipid 3 [Physcia stellaris]|nr:plasma membrane proteolipid 3 [Physcia stellaris]
MPLTASDICKIILAVLLPPLGVFLERGCNADFLINILLTILGYIPGIIHALIEGQANNLFSNLISYGVVWEAVRFIDTPHQLRHPLPGQTYP